MEYTDLTWMWKETSSILLIIARYGSLIDKQHIQYPAVQRTYKSGLKNENTVNFNYGFCNA
jgi:hypothetical protein